MMDWWPKQQLYLLYQNILLSYIQLFITDSYTRACKIVHFYNNLFLFSKLAFENSIYRPCLCLLIYHRGFCSTLPPQINQEHHPCPMSSELGFLPAMYSFPGLINVPEMAINIGPANTRQHLPGVSPPSTWVESSDGSAAQYTQM